MATFDPQAGGIEDRVILAAGDCRQVLALLADDSIDAVVTDPPAGIEFMGQAWDRFAEVDENASGPQTNEWHDNGGRNPYARSATPRYQGKNKASLAPFQDFIAEVFTEVHRVLRPGGHALVWAIPRTSHHTAMGVERAGFEVRDVITHLFATGFPKSLDVSKAIDKAAGKLDEREVIGVKPGHEDFVDRTDAHAAGGRSDGWDRPWRDDPDAVARSHALTAPATPEAERWEGWGTALKPAAEHWILARKPVEGTVAANVLEHGTGAINIDGCRLEGVKDTPASPRRADQGPAYGDLSNDPGTGTGWDPTVGRWPANVVLSHHEDCEYLGAQRVPSNGHHPAKRGQGTSWAGHHGQDGLEDRQPGSELVEAWSCVADCPVRLLDEQAGERRSGKPGQHRLGVNTSAAYGTESRKPGTPMSGYGDSGAASRFFFVAKPSRSERNAGLDDFEEKPILWSSGTQNPGSFQAEGTKRDAKNYHPTVKSIELMRWMCRLITPPGGVVLDPFMGSGTTGIACEREGFGFVGLENKLDYYAIARARITWALAHPEPAKPQQGDLFEATT